jgi:ATP-dependent RNA helicase RhlE
VSSTVEAIDQSLFFVDKVNKPGLLLYLLKHNNISTALVFTRTKHGADKVVKILHKENISAAAIHGNKSQNARQNALKDFKTGNLKVLVATDIAARGIDIDELTHVINFELPNVPETYVHRIGRTGRAGNTGIAFSFCDNEERTELRDIQKLIGKNIPVIDSHPYPLSAASFTPHITGPKAPSVRRPVQKFHSSDRGGRRGYGTQRTGNK